MATNRGVRWPALLLMITVALIGVVMALIAAGIWDPQPAGDHRSSTAPGLRTTGSPGAVEWLPELVLPPFSAAPATIRLQAAFDQGEADSSYGLVWGDDNSAVLVAVSPLGYAAVWEQGAPGEPALHHIPWRPWPHVRPEQEANELWLDLVPAGDRLNVTARVNREILWTGSVPAAGQPQAGLWLGSWGGPATVDFRELTLHTP